MWIVEDRAHYDHSWQRYPSDLIDEEWALVSRNRCLRPASRQPPLIMPFAPLE
jgi:hypothetical protein